MQPQPMQPAPGTIGSGPDQQFTPPPQPGVQPGQTPQQQPQQKKTNSTQNSLLLSELREGMVIMADGSFRAVIACKSINFDLMSSREREGVEYSYQNFLNALYFPIQIFIRSQRVDIGPYLDRLEEIRRGQDNMLLNVLMDDYIGFIDALAQEANIMDKSFFVVVPYFPSGDLNSIKEQGKGFFNSIFGGNKANVVTKIDKVTYEKAKDEVKNRVDSVINGLLQVGVQAVQLNTKQLGELYYNIYNPDTAVREPLGDFESVTSTYVRKATSPEVQTAPQTSIPPTTGGVA
jgi:type IV secretory pathway VirB4 component